MSDLGLAQYCLDIQSFDAGLLIATFIELVGHREEIRERMAERLAGYRRESTKQFDDLFPQVAR